MSIQETCTNYGNQLGEEEIKIITSKLYHFLYYRRGKIQYNVFYDGDAT